MKNWFKPLSAYPQTYVLSMCAKSLQSCLDLCDPMDCCRHSILETPWDSPGKYLGVGCHALLQGNLPDSGIKPASLMSPAMAGGFFITSSTWGASYVPLIYLSLILTRPNLSK